MASTEVLLCSDYHRMMPYQQLISLANHLVIYSRLTIYQVPPATQERALSKSRLFNFLQDYTHVLLVYWKLFMYIQHPFWQIWSLIMIFLRIASLNNTTQTRTLLYGNDYNFYSDLMNLFLITFFYQLIKSLHNIWVY